MKCPFCQFDNPADSSFCFSCRRSFSEELAPAVAAAHAEATGSSWAIPYQENPPVREDARRTYAGFPTRFLAYFIDGVVSNVLGLMVGVPLAVVIILGQAEPVTPAESQRQQDDLEAIVTLGSVAASGAYLVIATAIGKPIGAMAAGVRIVRIESGGRPGYMRAIVRVLMSMVSGLALGLGYLWSIWDPDKQTWHDKVAGTVVIKE